MKQIGLLKAIMLTSKYGKMSASERDKLREARLKDLVAYAKANSPYYKKLYEGTSDEFKLSELPVTNKRDMMEHFDLWTTDRDIRLADIAKFMENPDNIGRKFRGKYYVFTTSGSIGHPVKG